MPHFDDRQLIDFVRGALDPERHAELEVHVAACPECRAAASGWLAVSGMMARAGEPAPPDDAVRVAKSAHGLFHMPGVQADAIRFARLVFDSLISPSPVGARSDWPGERHCIYESDGYTVEFQDGVGRDNNKRYLTGQISGRIDRGARIKLVKGSEVAAQTAANAFGEFVLEHSIADPQWLLIEIPDHPAIAVPFPESGY